MVLGNVKCSVEIVQPSWMDFRTNRGNRARPPARKGKTRVCFHAWRCLAREVLENWTSNSRSTFQQVSVKSGASRSPLALHLCATSDLAGRPRTPFRAPLECRCTAWHRARQCGAAAVGGWSSPGLSFPCRELPGTGKKEEQTHQVRGLTQEPGK